jgi:hypothetical protein
VEIKGKTVTVYWVNFGFLISRILWSKNS